MAKYNYIGCDNASSATAKVVLDSFSEYEYIHDLPVHTTTYFCGSINDIPEFSHRTDENIYHIEYYVREVLNWESGRMGNWVKMEGGYSEGYYQMISRISEPVTR